MAKVGWTKSKLKALDPDAERAEWLGRLDTLGRRVKAWAEAAGWRTRLVSKLTRDSVLGKFRVPLLLMERDGHQIALNPVSRFMDEAQGAVDLYVVPAYDEVANLCLYEDDRWDLAYVPPENRVAPVGPVEIVPLTEEAFLGVINRMVTSVEQQI